MQTLVQFGVACWLALSMLGGCRLLDLDRAATVQGRSLLRPAGVSPGSVAMEIVWARFPAGDRQLNEEMWQEIDEASIEPAVARELAANGFRVGVIRGAPPEQLGRALKQGEADSSVPGDGAGENLADLLEEPTIRGRLVQARRGRRVEIQASDLYATLLLLTGSGHDLGGGTYRDAQAMYAMEVDPQPDRTALVQLTPELHHGAPRVRFQGDEGFLRQAPMKDHAVFDRLRIKVKLAPGESLLLMNLPDKGSRLGQYFHTVESADGVEQKLVLIRLAEVPSSDTFNIE